MSWIFDMTDKPFYVLHPGYVGSEYVQARDLLRLHGIEHNNIVVALDNNPTEMIGRRKPFVTWPADAIHLYPRFDGNYEKLI